MTDRGYTLIELSVVVLLIGTMLFLAVPRVRDTLLNDELRASTRRIVGAARELRDRAVRDHVDYMLHFDLAHPGFWTYSADTTAEKQAELRKEAIRFPDGIRIADVRRPEEAPQTEGEFSIRFSRRGYTEPAVVHLTKDERTFTIVFNPFLQNVGIYEKNIDFAFNAYDRATAF